MATTVELRHVALIFGVPSAVCIAAGIVANAIRSEGGVTPIPPDYVPDQPKSLSIPVFELPPNNTYTIIAEATSLPPEQRPHVLAITDKSIPLKLIWIYEEIGTNARTLAVITEGGTTYITDAFGLAPWGDPNRDQLVMQIRKSVPRGTFEVNRETGQVTLLSGTKYPQKNVPQTVKPNNPDLILFQTANTGSLPPGGLFTSWVGNLDLNSKTQTAELEIRGSQSLRIAPGGLQATISLGESNKGVPEFKIEDIAVIRGVPFLTTSSDFITVTAENPKAFLTGVLTDSTTMQRDQTEGEIKSAMATSVANRNQNNARSQMLSDLANETKPRTLIRPPDNILSSEVAVVVEWTGALLVILGIIIWWANRKFNHPHHW